MIIRARFGFATRCSTNGLLSVLLILPVVAIVAAVSPRYTHTHPHTHPHTHTHTHTRTLSCTYMCVGVLCCGGGGWGGWRREGPTISFRYQQPLSAIIVTELTTICAII